MMAFMFNNYAALAHIPQMIYDYLKAKQKDYKGKNEWHARHLAKRIREEKLANTGCEEMIQGDDPCEIFE